MQKSKMENSKYEARNKIKMQIANGEGQRAKGKRLKAIANRVVCSKNSAQRAALSI